MENRIVRLITPLFAGVLMFGIGVSLASASPLTDALEHLNKHLNNAKSLTFSAIVSTPQKDPKAPPTMLRVSGVMQSPNLLKLTVNPIGKAAANTQLPETFSCDGSTYSVYSHGLNQYSKAAAPKESFEADSPEVMYFIYSKLGEAGPTALDTAELFFPADFNIADEQLPKGLTRKITVTSQYITFDGHQVRDITQRVQGAHSTHLYHVLLSRNGSFVGWKEDVVGKDGKVSNAFSAHFTKLALSTEKLPLDSFEFPQMASATLFHAPASPGMTAPAFSAYKPDGTPIKLADYAGKVVVLDFWATWCPPCIKTLPFTDKLATQDEPKGIVFLPVCTWDTKKNFDKWVKTHDKATMTWLFDPAADEQDQSIASKLYAVAGIPTQYVVGKDGKIVYRGFADTDAGEKPLVDAIDKASAM